METFSCGVKIYTGSGSLSCLKAMGIRRLLLVTDPYFLENGTAQRVLALSGAEKTEVFHRISPDPTVTLAAEGTALVKSFDPDTVVALGGGSTIDCAKAMIWFAEKEIPLIAVPTTSGSGSEVTDFSVLTHEGVKHPLVDGRLLPRAAILDSDLLEGLPAGLIADTGFDMLSHALEALVATGATLFSDALAQEAFCTGLTLLPESYRGNRLVRGQLHQASAMAGMAFQQAGLGLCHAMAHVLGGSFHLPHGRLNAILLPLVIRKNANVCAHKYAALFRKAGLSGGADSVAVRNLCNALQGLRRALKLPQNLIEAGVSREQLRGKQGELVQAVLRDPCCKTNPLPVTQTLVTQLLDEVSGRG